MPSLIDEVFHIAKSKIGAFAVIFVILFAVLLQPLVMHIAHAQTSITAEQRAQLEQELADVEAQQKAAEKELSDAKSKSTSLANDIAVLNAKIKTAQLNIKAKTLLIQTLGNDIVSKQKNIDNLESHIDRGHESIADILRKTYELQNYSLPEVVLSQKTVSGFFNDVDTFDAVHAGMKETISDLKSNKNTQITEKNVLDTKRNAEMDARHAIEDDKKSIESNEAQKRQLLAVSKGNEKAYQAVVSDRKGRAAQIRAQLFALRDAQAIPFGKALQYANEASAATGVRPAFILAILTQESNLGTNVGQCYIADTQTGDGVYVKTGNIVKKVMSPTRDVPVFLRIMQTLGGDYRKTAVSCPLSVGWGGAMGPSQFIPSTWDLLSDQIAAAVGVSGMPDPWNPKHAITATALYVSDRGASAGTYSGERNAACRYYSGQSCGLVTGNTAYGNSVMALADKIQRTMIDPLQGF